MANSIVVFDRNPRTGLLTPAPGPSTPPKQVIKHGESTGTIWAAQFGQSGTELSADFDGNGSVGTGDYAVWAANFGLDYINWPGESLSMGGEFSGSSGAQLGWGPAAARQAVHELYATGQLNWQSDAEHLLGWGKPEWEKEPVIADFLFELDQWFDSLEA